ncbi:AlbA family DNA-binding domain-containing protein [Shewanella mangrovisoli]|uniref:AlbA family DNA-binding domain-containing protein n=1 Tax=Shewanella mangrovisoli TaxID=2864211 RepID=UPI00370A1FD2
MPKVIDTSIPDWASKFINYQNNETELILPASVEPMELAMYISALANSNGGNILLGAYSEEGGGSGFENVDSDVVKKAIGLLDGVVFDSRVHQARLQNIYLINVEKSEMLAFADGRPYILKNGKPILISETQLIDKLGLGIDSSLINMLSEQITKQSLKIDNLSQELTEKNKLKNQVPGLLVGGFIGWLLSTVLNILLGLGS